MAVKKGERGRMKTTARDIARIISGDPIEITVEYPLDDRPEGAKWFMRQPTDWEYDMAQAVREAARSEILALPDMQAAKKLPPTDAWTLQQRQAREETQKRIAELKKRQEFLTPEEGLELANLESMLDALVDPTERSRADEIAAAAATRKFEHFLMPLLIVDENGDPIFDLQTEEGRARWNALGIGNKVALRSAFYESVILAQKAKNSRSGQSSA